jgi:hypothetical protein
MNHPISEPEVALRNLEAAQRRRATMRLARANGGACESDLAMAVQAEVQAHAVLRLAQAAAWREEMRMKRRQSRCSIA